MLEFPNPLLRNAPTRLVVEDGEPGGVASRQVEQVVSYEEAFQRELEEFHAAIVEGREPRTGGEDGLRDVALCEAIVAGHATGRPVPWPTRPSPRPV
jgi:predicted dehydrogenase